MSLINHLESIISEDISQLVVETLHHTLLIPSFLVLGRGREEAH